MSSDLLDTIRDLLIAIESIVVRVQSLEKTQRVENLLTRTTIMVDSIDERVERLEELRLSSD